MTSSTLTRTLLALTATALSLSAAADAPSDTKPEAKCGGAGGGMLQRLDAEGKGYVTLEDFQAAGDAFFARLDADSDGRLSAEELAAAGRGWGRHTHKKPRGEHRSGRHQDRWFARMDADGDGWVSKAEFDEARMARFNALDVNGNGAIDADEFPAREGGRPGYGRRDRSRSK